MKEVVFLFETVVENIGGNKMEKGLFKKVIGHLVLIGLFVFIIGLYGCTSQSGNTGTESEESGDVIISLTDAEGDFVNYSVNVLSLTLTKDNGVVVETLPLTTQIDFAQYTEMTEFLTSSTVPHGIYTKATLMLDYHESDIRVEDIDGNSVKIETIKDTDGNSVTTLEVSVELKNVNKLVVARGIPMHLTLDFDLKSSNSVIFDEANPPELIVEPVLLVEVNPTSPKIHRLRGRLGEVNLEENNFKAVIRPFFHAISKHKVRFGEVKVGTTVDTIYEIDGQVYQGRDGLEVLSGLDLNTAIVAKGDVKFDPYRFEANEVYAGTSVPGGGMDVVTGNVISRVGNSLIIKGAYLFREDDTVIFNDSVTVLIGENTQVLRQLSKENYVIGDISVGQRIRAFGTLADKEDDRFELDVTEGYTRMLLTTLHGTVVSKEEDQILVADLQSIDKRQVSIFDFQGTGTEINNDADPENYEINIGTMSLASILSNSTVNVRGFVSPFGQAPHDFDAITVVDLSKEVSSMRVNWHPASTHPFESISSDGLQLNLDRAHLFHHTCRGPSKVDLKKLSGLPWIVPENDGQGVFSIKWRGQVKTHTNFDEFVEDIETRLSEHLGIKDLFATGWFDDDTLTLTSSYISIKLN